MSTVTAFPSNRASFEITLFTLEYRINLAFPATSQNPGMNKRFARSTESFRRNRKCLEQKYLAVQ
jgi:hypothetical protein